MLDENSRIRQFKRILGFSGFSNRKNFFVKPPQHHRLTSCSLSLIFVTSTSSENLINNAEIPRSLIFILHYTLMLVDGIKQEH